MRPVPTRLENALPNSPPARGLTFRSFLALDALPDGPGAYVLHDLDGRLLYVGKAKHLRAVVRRHYAPDEANPLIRGQAGGFAVYPTRGAARAEELEGELFDRYVLATGQYPPGNRQRPPGSRVSDDEIVRRRLLRLATGRTSGGLAAVKLTRLPRAGPRWGERSGRPGRATSSP